MLPKRKRETISDKFWEDSNNPKNGLSLKEDLSSKGIRSRFYYVIQTSNSFLKWKIRIHTRRQAKRKRDIRKGPSGKREDTAL